MRPTNREALINDLRRLLTRAPSDAKTLSDALGVSQPTFSRLWPTAGNDIIAFGAARAAQYALTRNIKGIGASMPIFRVTENGNVVNFGKITALAGNWYAYQFADASGVVTCEGLPYFLQDLRPQGFLGRMAPIENSDLDLPQNIAKWSDDDTLYYLARRGEDVVGNLIVGNESYRRFLLRKKEKHIPDCERLASYSKMAARAILGDAPGSSAGGEQPKFTAVIARDSASEAAPKQVIVKFSPDINTPNGRRWGDLLVAEHLALDALARNGISAANSVVLVAENRVFLEVERFDRVGSSGRAPMVSFAGIDGDLGLLDKNWSHVGGVLFNQKRISQQDLEKIRLLDLFGCLIGNSDRHPGNISVSWTQSRPFALLPSYDMLPMMYAPNSQGEVVNREFDPSSLDRLDLSYLAAAAALADEFCGRVLVDSRISSDFKTVVEQHARALPYRSADAQSDDVACGAVMDFS